MSGEWVGYFSHRAPASEGGGAAMQFASMQIELSDDGDAILGSGADGLGSFELQRGRRAVDVTPHSVEFSKVYTAVQAGYAPMGDAADGAAVEVFCEGTVEPRTSCIRGEWHMAFRFSGKAYREMDRGPQRSGGGECPAASTSTTTPTSTHSAHLHILLLSRAGRFVQEQACVQGRRRALLVRRAGDAVT